jgi:predicted small lipoprotein YifL
MLMMLSDLVRSVGRMGGVDLACLNVLALSNCGLNGDTPSNDGKGTVSDLISCGLKGGVPPNDGNGIVSGLDMVVISVCVQ